MLRVDALKSIQPSQYELWKYFEDRADRLGERLWSVGAWLMTVIAATLTLPFAANFIETSTAFFPVRVTGRLPLAMIAAFGMLFCIYSYAALRDVREHIEINWRKGRLRTQWHLANELGRSQESWLERTPHRWLARVCGVRRTVLLGNPECGLTTLSTRTPRVRGFARATGRRLPWFVRVRPRRVAHT